MIKKIIKIFFMVGAVFILLLFIGTGVILVLRNAGKSSLFTNTSTSKPQIASGDGPLLKYGYPSNWQDDWIIYDGNVYDYNDDIMTFLFMGIDKTDEEVKEVYGEINAGQADALFLLVLNPHDQTAKVIGVNRNTIADVDIYDEYGNYVNTRKAPIAVQHGFGDGKKQSGELQKMAVSKLFYSLPIHGYMAVNMSAIPALNAAVGGVDVTPRYSFSAEGYDFVEGQTVHLDGTGAFAYLHERDVTKAGSADLRLQRQKDYVLAFISKAKAITKTNPLLALDIYNSVEKQMTTDLTPQRVIYLSDIASSYSIDKNGFYLMEGVTRVGDMYEEFYPDEDALVRLMLEVFYDRVIVE